MGAPLKIQENVVFSSEELMAEVFKKLKGFENEQIVIAAVITVPESFKVNDFLFCLQN